MVIDVELPKRKNIRLQGYDYSQNGYYYITICTNNRQHLFGEIISVVGDGLSVPIIELNENGKIIDEYIKNVAIKYENVKIDKYIIMPNHVHIILVNSNYENGLETQNGTVYIEK
jgi:REP element-mobilizing transposase RayT